MEKEKSKLEVLFENYEENQETTQQSDFDWGENFGEEII